MIFNIFDCVIAYLQIAFDWYIRKGLYLEPGPPNHARCSLKILPMAISIS